MLSQKISIAVKLIASVYRFHEAGGSCHLVIDDGNVSDGALDVCESAANIDRAMYGEAQYQAEINCIAALRPLSEDERDEAVSLTALSIP